MSTRCHILASVPYSQALLSLFSTGLMMYDVLWVSSYQHQLRPCVQASLTCWAFPFPQCTVTWVNIYKSLWGKPQRIIIIYICHGITTYCFPDTRPPFQLMSFWPENRLSSGIMMFYWVNSLSQSCSLPFILIYLLMYVFTSSFLVIDV